jgi:hypothetical protein
MRSFTNGHNWFSSVNSSAVLAALTNWALSSQRRNTRVLGVATTDSSRSRKKVVGALPMAETRVEYARLMRQGISNAEACRTLNINRRTGMRWRHGRTVKKPHGRETTYAPISRIAPTVISPRYLSEDERVHVADALHAGTSLRQIATSTQLRDTIHKMLKDQWSPRQVLSMRASTRPCIRRRITASRGR